MELDWTTDSAGGVTLVRVRLRNERAVPRRVRLRNRLDGPVLPPRREREPEAGWDREGITTVVPAEETVALGYACPAPAAEPPVETTAVGAPDGAESEEPPVGEAIRRLGDARPPRAVLGGGTDRETAAGEPEADTREGSAESGGGDATDQGDDAERGRPVERECPTGRGRPTERERPAEPEPPSDPARVLEPYRRRVETVEALAVASVPEATDILRANGGVEGVERTGERLTDDAAALRALAAEATALAARAEAASPPTDALRRLS